MAGGSKMKVNKGDKVEVLIKKDLPCCTWRSGEIISGNGHYYSVLLVDVNGGNEKTERIPRKLVRPIPPPLTELKDFVVGDIVEMLDGVSWKSGFISKLISPDQYEIILLGSSKEAIANKSQIRAQQFWFQDKWLMLGMKKPSDYLSTFSSSGCSNGRTKRKLGEEDDTNSECNDANSCDLSDSYTCGSVNKKMCQIFQGDVAAKLIC